MKNIFVSGNQGYIGVELVKLLKQSGYSVTGCDCGLFAGCEWYPPTQSDEQWAIDFRELTSDFLTGFDTVIHLGAISNDPMGNMDPELTRSINLEGSIKLAHLAKEVGVERFLFAGSCSVYGQGESLDLDESSRMNPLTVYAESKIEAEKAILALADDSFSPASLRNATAYGSSAMLRLDLVVNNLLACAFTRGDICIKSDGTPWRPLIHCRDIARAFIAFLEAPREAIHAQAVNIGANTENFQVMDVARMVKELIPHAEVVFTGEVGHDPRNYRVNFDLLGRLLPDFKLHYTLESGMRELLEDFQQYGMTLDDFEGGRFIRLHVLQKVV
ncbi:MAG: UDP-glucose 4-epimerase [Chlamydiae bacterium]|nr:UDP-glucose 4-epimerase [Chlamydiota bacterium]